MKRLLLPLAMLPIIALLGWGLTRDARLVPSTLPGRPAPEFTLVTLDGDTLALAALRGKVVLLNFWASWCLACIDEHPLLVDAQRRWGPEGLQILGVVYQDTRSNAQRWFRERGGDWPNVLDAGSRVAINYGLFGVPETFFIDRRGMVAHKQIGPVTAAVLATLVPRLLADTTGVAPAGEPTVGRTPGHGRAGPDFPATSGTSRRE
jgi:cytochrome c biogenesis protein CcmG/thiol:disulfide interchange protein DsbE